MLGAVLLTTVVSFAVNAINLADKIEFMRLSAAAHGEPVTIDVLDRVAGGGLGDSLGADVANLYTSGQYVGLLVAMLFGVYLVAGEFARHTMTTTLLVEPRRHRVLGTKLVVAVGGGLALWALTLIVSLPAGVLFLHSQDMGAAYLNAEPVRRSILLNAVAFVVWAVLGVGLGCLVRRLTAAVIVAMLLYLTSVSATQMVFGGGGSPQPGLDLSVLVPSVASRRLVDVFTDGVHSSPWLGATVLLGYGLVSAGVGLCFMWRRDVT